MSRNCSTRTDPRDFSWVDPQLPFRFLETFCSYWGGEAGSVLSVGNSVSNYKYHNITALLHFSVTFRLNSKPNFATQTLTPSADRNRAKVIKLYKNSFDLSQPA